MTDRPGRPGNRAAEDCRNDAEFCDRSGGFEAGEPAPGGHRTCTWWRSETDGLDAECAPAPPRLEDG